MSLSMSDWIQATLAAHNELRAKHGAPPLEWCDECAEFAKKLPFKMAYWVCLHVSLQSLPHSLCMYVCMYKHP